jgi:hypothetical protein
MRPRAEGVRAQRSLRCAQLLALLLVPLIILTIIFGIWTATSVWSFPRFVIAIVFVVYLPGKLLLDIGGLGVRGLDQLTLNLIIGMASSGMLYSVLAYAGVSWVFLAWPLSTALVSFYRERVTWRETLRHDVSVGGSHVLLAVVIVLGLLPFSILPFYYRNLDLLPGSSMTYAPRPIDVLQHLSFAYELTHSVPPEVPFFSGETLGYHYGVDLLAAMLSRIASLSVLDLTVRFLPTFFLVTAALAIFCFSRCWLECGYGAAAVTFLVIFGEDLSFAPGLLMGSREAWSALFFGVPTTYSLYFMNPMLPTLGILFAGLFCLARYWKSGDRAWLILAAFLFTALAEYKIFTLVHVVGALGLTGLVFLALFRDQRPVRVVAATLALAVPLVTHSLLVGQGAANVWVRVEPWPYIPEALEQMRLSGTVLGREVVALFEGSGNPMVGLAALLVLGLPIYLLGSLGVRVVGIPGIIKGMLRPEAETGAVFFLALFCAIGPLATLALTVTPWGYPPESEYNNAVWFYVQAKYVMWLFVVDLALRHRCHKRWLWQVSVVAAILVLSVPSSVQYFQTQRDRKLEILGEADLELLHFLGRECPNGEVVLSHRKLAEHIVALTPCRIPVLTCTYAHLFVSQPALEQREEDVTFFWNAWREEDLRSDILERYEAAYVVIDKRSPDFTSLQPSWHNTSDLASERQVRLDPCFENASYVVYETRCDDCGE